MHDFWGVRGRLHIQRVSMWVNPWFRDVWHFVLTCMKSDERKGPYSGRACMNHNFKFSLMNDDET